MNIVPFVFLWGVLVAGVLSLALYRKFLANKEDNLVHVLDNDANLIPEQVAMTQKLTQIDHWGKMLTVLALVYGLVLAAFFLYQAWNSSGQIS